jgi:hypothetical protein
MLTKSRFDALNSYSAHDLGPEVVLEGAGCQPPLCTQRVCSAFSGSAAINAMSAL